MPQMLGPDGTPVDVPEEQQQQAFQAGKAGFIPGSIVHVVDPSGDIHEVPAEQAEAAFQQGYQLAGQKQVREQHLAKEYGGLGGTVAAGTEGLARGLTIGLFDPIAIGAAHAFGGQELGEKVRQHLAEEKEAHPYLSTAGEIAGAAAPLLLSGGAAAPEEAGILAKAAEGIRTLGAAPRGIGALGDVTEHAVGSILGSSAETVLGRAGQTAVKQALRGAVEGGLYSAGAQASDDALNNDPTTPEKLFSAIGHGALTAGLLGGGLGAFGSILTDGAKSAMGKLGPQIDEAAGDQAAKWLGITDKDAARQGGAKAVGQTVLDDVMKPLVEEKGITALHMTAPEKLEAIRNATDKLGKQIGDLVEGNADAQVPIADMLRPIDERIDAMKGKIAHEGQVKSLEDLKASVTRVLGGETPAPVAQRVERTQAEMAAYLKEHPEVLLQAGNGPLPESVRYKGLENVAPEAKQTVSIADAIQQRRALQEIAFKESKALDPNLRVQLMREISTEWNNLEEKVLNEVSDDSPIGTQLRGLNKRFSQLKAAETAVQQGASREGKMSLFETLGASHGVFSLLAGHPAAAAASVATSYAHKMLREHGNAYAALMLDRLGTFGGIGKAIAETNEGIDAAIASSVGKRSAGRPRVFRTSDMSQDRYDEEQQRVRSLASIAPPIVAAHMQHALNSMQTHSPQLASALQKQTSTATQYLASKLPPPPTQKLTSLTPHAEPNAPASAEQRTSFLRAVDAVEGGPPEILKRLAAGRMTSEDVEVMQKVYPHTFAEVQAKVAQRCADRTKPLPYQTKIRYGSLLGVPTDPTLDPIVIQSLQGSYLSHPQGGGTPQGPANRKGPAKLSLETAMKSDVESAMSSQ